MKQGKKWVILYFIRLHDTTEWYHAVGVAAILGKTTRR